MDQQMAAVSLISQTLVIPEVLDEAHASLV
jgi:hypothetical protein